MHRRCRDSLNVAAAAAATLTRNAQRTAHRRGRPADRRRWRWRSDNDCGDTEKKNNSERARGDNGSSNRPRGVFCPSALLRPSSSCHDHSSRFHVPKSRSRRPSSERRNVRISASAGCWLCRRCGLRWTLTIHVFTRALRSARRARSYRLLSAHRPRQFLSSPVDLRKFPSAPRERDAVYLSIQKSLHILNLCKLRRESILRPNSKGTLHILDWGKVTSLLLFVCL